MTKYIKYNGENHSEYKGAVSEYCLHHSDLTGVWVDTDSQQVFGYSNKNEIENPHPGNFNCGGWYNFHLHDLDWSNQAAGLYKSFFLDTKDFGNLEINSECLYTDNFCPHLINDKKVLVIGGGPSVEKNIDKIVEISENYDILVTCNHFFLNDKLNKLKFDYIFLSEEVDLQDERLISYLNEHNPYIGFEHGSTTKIKQIQGAEYFDRNPKVFIYMTRYFSRLGYTSRQVVFFGLFSPLCVDFVGLDGFVDKEKTHSFQDNKKQPYFYDKEQYNRLGIIFWDYLLCFQGIDFNHILSDKSCCQFAGFKEAVEKGIVIT